jgi:hypothetical protein
LLFVQWRAPRALPGGVLAGDDDRTTAGREARRVTIARARDACSALHARRPAAVWIGQRQQDSRRSGGNKEHTMTTETQTRVIVLQLSDDILAQLQPYLEGLDITATLHSEWAYQEVYEQGQFAGYEKVEQQRQRLTMGGEVYDALIARVNGALDYDVRWQPNEYESDGFVERVRPLELTNSSHSQEGCPTCGAQLLANRLEVVCVCGQAVNLG